MGMCGAAVQHEDYKQHQTQQVAIPPELSRRHVLPAAGIIWGDAGHLHCRIVTRENILAPLVLGKPDDKHDDERRGE